jgi:hypothetical protein
MRLAAVVVAIVAAVAAVPNGDREMPPSTVSAPC